MKKIKKILNKHILYRDNNLVQFSPEGLEKAIKELEDFLLEKEKKTVEGYIRKESKRLSKMYGDKEIVDMVVESELYDLQQEGRINELYKDNGTGV